MKIVQGIKDIYANIKWGIVIAMIIAGVGCFLIVGVIFLYLFAALAHIQSAFGYARAFLWNR
jgi:hypothetical protein